MRADQLLVERGLAVSRSQAQRLIASGVRWCHHRPDAAWHLVKKNGDELQADVSLELLDDAQARYVSRGGLKLEGALETVHVIVKDALCLDVGQSSGGFTDCLLQRSAAHVVGVDVGRDQLHPRLRSDERVQYFEGVNARDTHALEAVMAQVQPAELPQQQSPPAFDLITGDVSFISLTLILPAIVPYLASDGQLLMLVKPQFELQPEHIGKGGLVKDAASYALVENRLREACQVAQLRVLRWFDSPIAGGDGNREFFIHANRFMIC